MLYEHASDFELTEKVFFFKRLVNEPVASLGINTNNHSLFARTDFEVKETSHSRGRGGGGNGQNKKCATSINAEGVLRCVSLTSLRLLKDSVPRRKVFLPSPAQVPHVFAGESHTVLTTPTIRAAWGSPVFDTRPDPLARVTLLHLNAKIRFIRRLVCRGVERVLLRWR